MSALSALVPAAWPVAAASTVGGLMRAGVAAVDPGDRLAAAAARMQSRRVAALAVMTGGRLAGIVCERDVLRAVADGLSTDALQVTDCMGSPPATIGVGEEATAAARLMVERGVQHLPVVGGGQVIGVISARDLLVAWGVPPRLLDL
jgi:CBS domain-containing protein